jgi:HTH-type transcriptional regulator/antitoxin HigA
MTEDATHKTPGHLIESLLAERGWNQRILAVIFGVTEPTISKLIGGKKAVDARTALMLGEIFDVPAERFLALQKSYELAQAQLVARPDPGRSRRAHIYGGLPIADMIKRGWIDARDARDTKKVEAGLVRFFGASKLDEIEILPHAAKRTNVVGDATPVQLAWLYRVKQIADGMLTPPYSPGAVRDAVGKLKPLLVASQEARKVPRILAEAGIRFVIVESLPGSKIDGVCFWLDEETPVIGMTFRFDRIDNFWFVLRHEIEHILRLHGRAADAAMLDADLEGERAGTGENVSEEERVANQAAIEFCVPQSKMDRFVKLKAPFYYERDLLGFANTIGVHPGLVAGQLRYRTGRYDLFAAHLTKVRSIVAPGAIVDGWGDVASVDT